MSPRRQTPTEEIHYWTEGIREPPCGTLEDRFAWSDTVEDVTCEACRTALAGDGGEIRTRSEEDGAAGDHPAP